MDPVEFVNRDGGFERQQQRVRRGWVESVITEFLAGFRGKVATISFLAVVILCLNLGCSEMKSLLLGVCVGGIAYLMCPRPDTKVVGTVSEARFKDNVEAFDGAPEVDNEGHLVMRVGVALRIAKEVKVRFGGTPKYSEANWLLSARYITDACEAHLITRKVDQWTVLTRARPIVFTKLPEEAEEMRWVNSRTAADLNEDAEGWCNWGPWGEIRRRVMRSG